MANNTKSTIAMLKEDMMNTNIGDYNMTEKYIAEGNYDMAVTANMPLVLKMAKKYKGCGLPFEDVVQEGAIGLMNAVKAYDPSKGVKFVTYAAYWVKQGIMRSLASTGKTIRVPENVSDNMNRLRKLMAKLNTDLGHEPTIAEIAKAAKTSEKTIEHMLNLMGQLTSLDTTVGEDKEDTIGSLIKDENAEDAFDVANHKELQKTLAKVLKSLTPQEAKVITMRFGLGDDKPKTLEVCAKVLGVSKERVRQIEGKAMYKLRNKNRAEKLVDYIG